MVRSQQHSIRNPITSYNTIQQHNCQIFAAIVDIHCNDSTRGDSNAQNGDAHQYGAGVVEVVSNEQCPMDQIEAEKHRRWTDQLQIRAVDRDHTEEVDWGEDDDLNVDGVVSFNIANVS